MARRDRSLVIACGALAWEIMALVHANGWDAIDVECLPADWHNRPERISEAVRAKIREARERYAGIFVAYGDCGTGGLLDAVLDEEGVERIPGAHCYQFFAGEQAFLDLHDEEPGTFYLTDYLAKHFDVLVIRGMGLDRHPELMPMYFGNYRRLVYLAQTEDPAIRAMAEAAAEKLGLTFEHRFTGYGGLAPLLGKAQQTGASH
ncbi:MAG: DUF1638 domain-containing protein [Alphaproteobacteria bacterium]|nr:DUF1638 domain-containing protein [Alphaproteobacteria bacterium]